MIVHIVMIKFKEQNKATNMQRVKLELQNLKNLIDELKFMEVGINFDDSQRAFDMSLYSKFDTKEDLNIYAVHKEHLKVVEFIKSTALETKVVDYEL